MKLKDFFVPTKNNAFRAYLLKVESIGVLTLIVLVTNMFFSYLPISSVQAKMDLGSIVFLHNRERAKRSLGQLAQNSKLAESARKKAEIMLENDCWDHYCPPGTSPWDIIKAEDYKYLYAGENLAEGFDDFSTMMQAWMKSPTHRENVLKPEFTEIGIGEAEGRFQNKSDNLIVAVHFGHPQPEVVPVRNIETSSRIENREIVIKYPQNGNLINTEKLNLIAEIMTSDISEVALIVDGKEVVRQTVSGSSVSIFLEDFRLSDGEHTVSLEGYNGQNAKVGTSSNTKFTIDRKSATPDFENIELIELSGDEELSVHFEIPFDSEISETRLESGELKLDGIALGNHAEFFVDYSDLKNRNFEMFVEDGAGNTSNFILQKTKLLESVDKLMEKDSISELIPISQRLGIANDDVEILLGIFNSRVIFNLTILLVIAILLIIDYSVIKKYNLIDLHRFGNHHIKLGLLVVIGIITLLSSGYGHLLTGISV